MKAAAVEATCGLSIVNGVIGSTLLQVQNARSVRVEAKEASFVSTSVCAS